MSPTRLFLPLICSRYLLLIIVGSTLISCNKIIPSITKEQHEFLKNLKQKFFNYLLDILDTSTWQTEVQYPAKQFSSITATDLTLLSYLKGIKNGISVSHRSIPFNPKQILKALFYIKIAFVDNLHQKYGVNDVLNLTYIVNSKREREFYQVHIGINQNPKLLNYRTYLIYSMMKKGK